MPRTDFFFCFFGDTFSGAPAHDLYRIDVYYRCCIDFFLFPYSITMREGVLVGLFFFATN